MTTENRESWSGKLYFIFTAIGAAVGLGNIWKFPYTVGQSGGSGFILYYVLSIFFVVLPLFIAELAIGRNSRCNSYDAFAALSKKFKKSHYWSLSALFGFLTAILILSFYVIVSGWSIYYLMLAATGKLQAITISETQQIWSMFSGSFVLPALFHTIFIVITMWVISKGVNNGLEKLNIVCIPLLIILLMMLIFYVFINHKEGFYQAFDFLFSFDLSALKSHTALINALGQAFFSMAVGVGAMIVYGSYLPNDVPIVKSSVIIAIAQLLVGLLSGIAVFSVVFSVSDITIKSGPELMFVVLPAIFSNMAAPLLLGIAFFLVLFFAALTSSVNIAELLVAVMSEKLAISRKRCSGIIGIVVWLIGIILVLSVSNWSDVKFFGLNLFELTITLSANYMLPIGGIMIAIYIGWILPKHALINEFTGLSSRIYSTWLFLLKLVVPTLILVIILYG